MDTGLAGWRQCLDSVVLRVLGKQFVPLLPACLVFATIIRFLAGVGGAGGG
jgi:hypothetical protein